MFSLTIENGTVRGSIVADIILKPTSFITIVNINIESIMYITMVFYIPAVESRHIQAVIKVPCLSKFGLLFRQCQLRKSIVLHAGEMGVAEAF